MSKILAISDPHFHNYKEHSTLIEGRNSRLIDIGRAMMEAVEIGKSENCETCCISGDIFHVRGSIRPSVFSYAHAIVRSMACEIPVIMLAGNHDMEHYDGGATAIKEFREIKNVTVLDSKSPSDSFGRVDYYGIPYTHNPKAFMERFEEVLKRGESPDVFLIHQGVDDYAGPVSETGVMAGDLTSLTDAWILSGHYHSPKKIGKYIQVGAPVQHSFGDEGSDRGCWIIDIKKDSAEFKSLEFPKFCTVHSLKEITGLKADVEGGFVRIKSPSLKSAVKMREKCQGLGAKSVIVQIEKTFVSAHERVIKISTPEKMLCEYLDIMPEYIKYKKGLMSLFDEVCKG